MKANVNKNPMDCFYKVLDIQTGKEIQKCLWADDETGEYCIDISSDHQLKTIIKKGKIKIIDTKNHPTRRCTGNFADDAKGKA